MIKRKIVASSILLSFFLLMGMSLNQVKGEDSTGWISSASVHYHECDDYLSFNVEVTSYDGNLPDSVYASLNDTINYTLVQTYRERSPAGIYIYEYYVAHPAKGFFNVSFYSTNSSGTFKFGVTRSVNITTFDEAEYVVKSIGLDTEKKGYYSNDFLFRASFLECFSKDISDVVLHLNGSSYSMTWNESYEKFVYPIDFGIDDNNYYVYNVSFKFKGTTYWSNNRSLYTSTFSTVTNLWGSLYYDFSRDPNKVNFNVKLEYQTWINKKPELRFEIDGNNISVPVKFNKGYNIQKEGYPFYDTVECKDEPEMDWRNYFVFGPYNISNLEPGVPHTIVAYAYDGENWVSDKILDNITYECQNTNENINIEIESYNTTIDGNARRLEVSINVSSSYLTDINVEIFLKAIVEGPWYTTWYPASGIEVSSSDRDLSNGKLFTMKLTSYQRDFFGQLKFWFYFFYVNNSGGVLHAGYYNSSTIMSFSNNMTDYEMSIKPGDWFIFKSMEEEKSCSCCDSSSTYIKLFRVVNVGYALGATFVEYDLFYWKDCPDNKTWLYKIQSSYSSLKNSKIFNYGLPANPAHNFSKREWLYEDALSSLRYFIPLDLITKKISNEMNYSIGLQFSTISGSTGKGSVKTGDAKTTVEYSFTNKGVLKRDSYSVIIDCLKYNYQFSLIKSGHGAIPSSPGSSLIPGYDPTIMSFALVISVIGVIMVFLRKKKRFHLIH
ncbi:MAG: hypothetical protein ACTSXU_11720 [Promethearchaeota archaeon]